MDDHYQYVDTEIELQKSSPKSRVKSFVGKFFLAIIAVGLIVLLVFQIMIISATSSGVKATGGAVVDPTPADDTVDVPDTPVIIPSDDTKPPVDPKADDTNPPVDPAEVITPTVDPADTPQSDDTTSA